ncbi:Hypothetical_protein [Hexamita inflata]|uniref:Hypothetical_protein n=1 Tax=Hexamita inflata TaxID=28002 RepID=A0AA86R991_9EUKA|nr:Hypothetical protein HINF_LOCUS56228 [Hexamita inflata]
MKQEFAKKPESDYMIKMTKRYSSQVENGKLVVDNDQEITHFMFTDYLLEFEQQQINVQPVSALSNINQFSAEQNFITDFPSIKSLPHFNYSFVSPQNTPNTQDLENYHRSTNFSTSVQQLSTQIQNSKQATIDILNEAKDDPFIKKYQYINLYIYIYIYICLTL